MGCSRRPAGRSGRRRGAGSRAGSPRDALAGDERADRAAEGRHPARAERLAPDREEVAEGEVGAVEVDHARRVERARVARGSAAPTIRWCSCRSGGPRPIPAGMTTAWRRPKSSRCARKRPWSGPGRSTRRGRARAGRTRVRGRSRVGSRPSVAATRGSMAAARRNGRRSVAPQPVQRVSAMRASGGPLRATPGYCCRDGVMVEAACRAGGRWRRAGSPPAVAAARPARRSCPRPRPRESVRAGRLPARPRRPRPGKPTDVSFAITAARRQAADRLRDRQRPAHRRARAVRPRRPVDDHPPPPAGRAPTGRSTTR